ncbi:hypothetical protein Pst134EA_021361 [Puccinia striiformis f. sp. tritici]|uniref:hypothetical protein n=1 Tax=Puccinia striiformis f. sp. tritici TaxID=168172 RepID=UPI00200887BB|nr:hypothetical protein Pst134EA_021361 [Puccinia striiformis f. sp. tritici]KAH9457486.1 hypothetical protein Pst134EA_021361 [Puccinia striiformis f. sp. tritici]KAI9627646.1 hypothetical protein KEM48_012109 [Puccinia striiformis f. sp. tritici PST-130]
MSSSPSRHRGSWCRIAVAGQPLPQHKSSILKTPAHTSSTPHHWYLPVCRLYDRPSWIRTVSMPTVRIDVPNGDAYQRLRRRLYAERNKATLERMNQREAQYRQLREAQEEAQRTAINVVDPEEARHLNHQQDKHAQEAGSRHEQGRKRKR